MFAGNNKYKSVLNLHSKKDVHCVSITKIQSL